MGRDARKKIHIFFSGLVQGVGFRFTSKAIANRLGINGWVRNTQDGRVEMFLQGEAEDIDKFLDSLKDEFRHNITGIDIKKETGPCDCKNFSIRF
ncbi:MAG: acylphosphatase [Candidatus Omnitrophica bacterium]|nr:acylphosphatase [Candidatus Omnitrophota bacterium]MBD3269848.1 acylphosphatase [Candidatus Omnitrophota bacterium]